MQALLDKTSHRERGISVVVLKVIFVENLLQGMDEDQLNLTEHDSLTGTSFYLSFERKIINQEINNHIESLKAKIEEKNEEISSLQKKLRDLEDKNKKLDIALKTRIEEISKLKSRINKLESEKKGLEDKLRNVEGKLDRVEKEVQLLEEAKFAHEEENANLREKVTMVSEEMESVKEDLEKTRNENQVLKREVKELQDSQHKLLPLTSGRPMLTASQVSPDLQASLRLGELSRQLQTKMYAYVFPQSFSPIGNYKVKNIRRDVDKLPKTATEEEKTQARKRWEQLQKKLNWDEAYEDAVKLLQENRNVDAHPKISFKLLQEAAETMDEKGSLKGRLSRECIDVLIQMWKQLQ